MRLSGGIQSAPGDRRCHEVDLGPVSEGNALRFVESAEDVGLYARLAEVLAASLLGPATSPVAGVDLSRVHDLHAGDQDLLLLELYALMVSPTLEATTRCSSASCQEPFDVSFDLADLPRLTGDLSEDPFTLPVPDEEIKEVTIRLPRVADRIAVETLPTSQRIRGLRLRCVEAVDGEATDFDSLSALSDEALASIDEELTRRAPGIVATISALCPECGHLSETTFEPARFVAAELDIMANRLLDEVHVLAWTYHWTEQEILGLSKRRRQAYLEMIRREVDDA